MDRTSRPSDPRVRCHWVDEADRPGGPLPVDEASVGLDYARKYTVAQLRPVLKGRPKPKEGRRLTAASYAVFETVRC